MFLDNDTFRTVIDSTPLVALDLIIQSKDDLVLLGKRNNRPAKDYWFVPGGRILKNESLAAAFARLTKNELGQVFSISSSTLIGAYDHFYGDSVFGETPSTHYVVIAYRLESRQLLNLPKAQHSDYCWLTVDELLVHPDVHPNTKAYFTKDAS